MEIVKRKKKERKKYSIKTYIYATAYNNHFGNFSKSFLMFDKLWQKKKNFVSTLLCSIYAFIQMIFLPIEIYLIGL